MGLAAADLARRHHREQARRVHRRDDLRRQLGDRLVGRGRRVDHRAERARLVPPAAGGGAGRNRGSERHGRARVMPG